jgi:ATP/maltotriose-dependent transcriptional regulator MalT
VRGLKGADDRGSLCEAQRALAMVLAEKGELDEAERLALEARETVGPEDRVSVATTALGLGVVRAAQGRAEEAEQLMREAIDGFHSYDMRALEHWALRYLSEFLRAQGRLDEADAYASRRAELAPASTAPIV